MRAQVLVLAAASLAAAVSPSFAATSPPGFVTFVTGGAPDPNGKVPAFNVVPGAGVPNFSIANPQGAFVHGGIYTYCIATHDLSFTGNSAFSYKITRKVGTTVTTLQSKVLIKNFAISPGIWAFCINGAALPNSPGLATLTGAVTYATTPKATVAKLSVPIILQ
jgi:hypothetical protein